MTLAAATATSTLAVLGWLALAAVLALAGYALVCAVSPFARCRACAGAGERPGPILRRLRPCTSCAGTGRRLRIGRRLFNHFARLRRDGTRIRDSR
jgi:hypothetical protein